MLNLGWAQYNEYGQITYLTGSVAISRNSDYITPTLSSRVYLKDTVLVSNNGAVKIKSHYDNYLVIKDQGQVTIISPKNYYLSAGTFYIKGLTTEEYIINTDAGPQSVNHDEFVIENKRIIELNNKSRKLYNWGVLTDFSDLEKQKIKPKSIKKAATYTLIFPGMGHYYLENKNKALFMSLASSYLLYNAIMINPGDWSSEINHEIMYNKKEQFKQTYLVYLGWALIDTIGETKEYNKRISYDDEQIKVSFIDQKL